MLVCLCNSYVHQQGVMFISMYVTDLYEEACIKMHISSEKHAHYAPTVYAFKKENCTCGNLWILNLFLRPMKKHKQCYSRILFNPKDTNSAIAQYYLILNKHR